MNRYREFFILLAMLGSLFAPSLVTAFLHHDQYRYFREDFGDPEFKQHCYNDSENGSIRTLGRPLGAKLECFVFFHVHKVRDLTYFRVLVVIGLTLTALILSIWMQGMQVQPWPARLLAVGIMALPGGQNAVFMTNLPNALTPLLAMSAGILALRKLSLRSHIPAFLLLGIAYFTYSPMIFQFFVPLVISLILDQRSRDKLWKITGQSLFIFAAASAVFFQFGRKKFLSNPNAMPEAYQMRISPSLIPENIPRFLHSVLPMEFKAWDVYSELFGPVLLAIGLITLALPSPRRKGAAVLGILIFLGANTLFLMTNAYVLYRVAWPAMAMLLVLSFGPSLVARTIWLRGAAMAALSAGLMLAGLNNFRNVGNSRMELDMVMAALKDAGPVTRIHIVAPPFKTKGFNGFPSLTDEINVPTTSYIPGFFADVIQTAYIELGQNRIIVSGKEIPESLDNVRELIFEPAPGGKYNLLHNQKIVGIMNENSPKVKLLPWEAKGRVTDNGKTLDMWLLGQWKKIVGPEDSLAGRWSIHFPDPVVYVTIGRSGEPGPLNAFVIGLDRHQ